MTVGDEILDLKEGNHKTFEFLFKKYYVFLCYEARSYITEKHIIEEIVGDVFRWLWENRETLVITTSVRAYLVRAVHNACLSYLRRNQPEYIELDETIVERNTLFSLDESPLDYVLSKELIERIGKAVKELPHKQIKWIENKLNNRPRKRLGYLTPNEKFKQIINQKALATSLGSERVFYDFCGLVRFEKFIDICLKIYLFISL